MENKERQILSEIMDMMASLRSQMEALDAKIVELQQSVNQDDEDMVPIDLDIDDVMVEVLNEPEPEVEDLPDDDLPFDDLPAPERVVAEPVAEPEDVAEPVMEPEVEPEPTVESEPEVESVMEPEPVVEPEPVAESEPEPIVESVPEIDPVTEPVQEQEAVVEPEPDPEMFMEPEPVAEPVVEAVLDAVEPKVAVIDSMTDRQAWRTDMPGSPVRDIRSAISLNDRILFINRLFAQDPMAFQESLTRINQMESLDEAVSYVMTERPDWDLESETVYRFMMAVRRKIQK